MVLGSGWGVTCLVPTWHPAYRRREAGSGFGEERENLSSRCEGRSSSGTEPARARVPMRGTGAETLVVGMKVL